MLYAVGERAGKEFYKRNLKLVVDITPVQDGVLKVDYWIKYFKRRKKILHFLPTNYRQQLHKQHSCQIRN